MSVIAKAAGQRIRNYRTRVRFSQEKLAEMSEYPPHISVSWGAAKRMQPFEQLGGQDDGSRNIPLAFNVFLSAKTPEEQEQLFKILLEMDKYRSK